MDLGLQDTVAVVTGASSGLGKAVAAALSREGCRVGICSRSRERIEQAANEITAETGNPVLGIPADVTDQQQVSVFLDQVAEKYGGINILVSNAGGPPSSNFETTSPEMWEDAWNLTLKSAIRLSDEVLPYMKSEGWGRIIYLVSLSAKEPIDGLILSNVIRPGVLGLSKSLANELAQFNILVNSVCPGYIATQRLIDLSEKWAEDRGTSPEQVREAFSEKIPLRRLGTPEEFADVVLFLASKRAAYVTGTVVQVDGGRAAGLY